ncbi:hypothetical protein BJV82DRAFT_260894 [Fennellomyces sp. T-0311]|nr:hypothetical protein BJV82DRAFT_260894 [Fennellomyces sp. T-0311]
MAQNAGKLPGLCIFSYTFPSFFFIMTSPQEHLIIVQRYSQVEDGRLQTETRRFPIHSKTRYKRLHRQVRKGFGIEEGFDLAYPMTCQEQDTQWISMTGDHDIAFIATQPSIELKIVPSHTNISMNPIRRGWRKSINFVGRHGPNVVDMIQFFSTVLDAVQPIVLRITDGKKHRHR